MVDIENTRELDYFVGLLRFTVLTERAVASFYWGELKIVYLISNGCSVTLTMQNLLVRCLKYMK